MGITELFDLTGGVPIVNGASTGMVHLRVLALCSRRPWPKL
jgi:hypothetical protein